MTTLGELRNSFRKINASEDFIGDPNDYSRYLALHERLISYLDDNLPGWQKMENNVELPPEAEPLYQEYKPLADMHIILPQTEAA